MALDFPDNPTDGEVYVASNGIQYTYNATTDSWTGALGTGSSYWSEQDNGSGNIYVTDTNANVGIGTASPQAALDVSKTPVAGEPGLLIGTHSLETTSDIALTDNAIIRSEDSIRSVVNTGGIFTWSIGGDDHKAGVTGASEAMRIDPNGGVGIGTNSPASRLDVNGTIRFTTLNLDDLPALPS